MVLDWIVLFGELHETIINQGEIFKGTLGKPHVFGRSSKIKKTMIFKMGGGQASSFEDRRKKYIRNMHWGLL